MTAKGDRQMKDNNRGGQGQNEGDGIIEEQQESNSGNWLLACDCYIKVTEGHCPGLSTCTEPQ
jgi:hypothetical protein